MFLAKVNKLWRLNKLALKERSALPTHEPTIDLSVSYWELDRAQSRIDALRTRAAERAGQLLGICLRHATFVSHDVCTNKYIAFPCLGRTCSGPALEAVIWQLQIDL